MGKNIKSYATIQVHSPGKGREALWQQVQIFHLKYGTAYPYILFAFKITSKIFQIPSVKFQRITQIPRSSPPQSANSANFAHFTLCFRHLPRQRTLQIPANYANSAQFAHTVRVSREIRTFC